MLIHQALILRLQIQDDPGEDFKQPQRIGTRISIDYYGVTVVNGNDRISFMCGHDCLQGFITRMGIGYPPLIFLDDAVNLIGQQQGFHH